MSSPPASNIALRRALTFGELSVQVSERAYHRATCMTRDLGLQYQADTRSEPAILMVYLPRGDGQSAMHAHTARSSEPRALHQAAEELITRIWRAYARAAEEATA